MSDKRKKAAAQETLFVEPAKGEVKTGDVVTDAKLGEMKVVGQAPAKKKSAVAKAEPKNGTAVATVPQHQNLLAALFSAISDPTVDPAKVHVLLDARDRLMKEQAKVEFFSAYIDLQSELPSIRQDGKLDQGTTKTGRAGVATRFATFQNINAITKPILAKRRFGMLLLPDVPAEGSGIIIRGQLGYVCETQYGKFVHVESCVIPVPPEVSGGKNAAQGVGSSLSYGKRYGAIALLNLVSHAPEDADDDAGRKRRPAPADRGDQAAEGAKLSADDVKKLRAAIEFCGVSDAAFCKHYSIAKVDDLPASALADALAACKDHAENREGKATHG